AHARGLPRVAGPDPPRCHRPPPADRYALTPVRRHADPPAPARVHRLRGPAADDALAEAVEHQAAGAPGGDELLAHRLLIKEAPTAIAPQRDPFSGAQRVGIGDVTLERHETALAREDVLVLGLDVPERPKTERVDAKDAGVPDARQDRLGPLRERNERGVALTQGAS